MQVSKDLMCHVINHGLESITDGWYCLLLGGGDVLVELNATKTYREFPFFWRKQTVLVPFNFECSNDQISLPVEVQMSGIVNKTGKIDSFELRNKDHAKWCIRGSCDVDGESFGMTFSSLCAVLGSTIVVDCFNMTYNGNHF